MDSQQAKETLKAYRPGVDDAEPSVAEALSSARRDAELSRWLDKQVALDAVLRAKLKGVVVPIGLKTRILANAPMAQPVTAWWQHPVWLAAAASICGAGRSRGILDAASSSIIFRSLPGQDGRIHFRRLQTRP